ncbi:putative transmembrane protein [Pasteurella multocida]|uniref:hypothetical protein n=1 Tax=Pasteurella multocida TaxID=747 RepID=UPI000DA3291A|nr:hypothetical protein [Pasteurella multocida]MDT8779066.1 hypothetical protein [Pasteurella multocida]SQI51670.1 putative transmembrane protein [Pasteurella multocida]
MQYFDIKKSLPVFCSLLITACSGGGGGNNPSQYPKEVRPVVTEQAKTAKEKSKYSDLGNHKEPEVENKLKEQPKVSLLPEQQEKIPSKIPLETEKANISLWKGKSQRQKGASKFSNKTDDDIYNKEHIVIQNLTVSENPYNSNKIIITEKEITLSINKDVHSNSIKQQENDATSYDFSLLNENAYYGYYNEASEDHSEIYTVYVLGYKESMAYTPEQNLNANYKGGFWYTAHDKKYVGYQGDAELLYANGEATGNVYKKGRNDNDSLLFKIKSNGKPDQLVFMPQQVNIPNGPNDLAIGNEKRNPDGLIMNVTFVKGNSSGKDDAIIGSGENDKYRAILGLKKEK